MSEVAEPAVPPAMLYVRAAGVFVLAFAGIGVLVPLIRGVAPSAWSTALLGAQGVSLYVLGSPKGNAPWIQGTLVAVAIVAAMEWVIGGLAG